MNEEFKDYYKILDITRDASEISIESAYKGKKNSSFNDPIGLLNIEEAYSILSSPSKRKEYDEKLKIHEYRKTVDEKITEFSATTDTPIEFQEKAKAKLDEISASSESFDDFFVEINKKARSNIFVSESTPEPTIFVSESTPEPTIETRQESTMQYESNLDSGPTSEPNKHEPYIDPLVDELTKVEPKVEDKRIENDYVIETSKKDEAPIIGTGTLKIITSTGLILGGIALGGLGIVGGITGAIILNEIIDKVRKCRLNRPPKEEPVKEITEVETAETRLINEYDEKLNKQIEELLEKPLNSSTSYELEIAILKYQNRIELLNKRIDYKINEAKKSGIGILCKLEILALEKQLEKSQKNLANLNLLKQSKTIKREDSKLTKLNDDIYNEKVRLSNEELSRREKDSSKLKIIKMNNKRIALKEKMILDKDSISSKQVRLANKYVKEQEEKQSKVR